VVRLILDAAGACGLALTLAARRRRARGAGGEAALRRAGGILLAIAVLGRLGVGFAMLGRPHG